MLAIPLLIGIVYCNLPKSRPAQAYINSVREAYKPRLEESEADVQLEHPNERPLDAERIIEGKMAVFSRNHDLPGMRFMGLSRYHFDVAERYRADTPDGVQSIVWVEVERETWPEGDHSPEYTRLNGTIQVFNRKSHLRYIRVFNDLIEAKMGSFLENLVQR